MSTVVPHAVDYPDAVAYRGDVRSSSLLRVLVLDDHAQLRKLLATALAKHLPAEAHQACTVHEAVALAADHTFDAVLTDLNLAGESGLDALPRLRAAFPRARLVLMSAAPGPGLAKSSELAGADAFVPKSAGVQAMCSAVLPDWAPR